MIQENGIPFVLSFQDRSVAAYIALANMSLEKEELGWPSRPKFHVPRHVMSVNGVETRLDDDGTCGFSS